MSTSSKQWPDTFTLSDIEAVEFIAKAQKPIFSREWIEVAEYKLVKIRRVRIVEEWADEKK